MQSPDKKEEKKTVVSANTDSAKNVMADPNHDAKTIANASIKQTIDKAASDINQPAKSDPTASKPAKSDQPAKVNKKANKGAKRRKDGLNKTTAVYRSSFIERGVDQAVTRDEIQQSRLVKNPKIKDSSVRSELLGTAGMKADTHSRVNGYLSGMTAKELRIFQDFKLPASLVSKSPDQGGFSREHKLYVFSICCSIASGKLPCDLDLSHLSAAAKKIDPKFSAKTKGHNTITLLIKFLKTEKSSFSINHWDATYNGVTQANYLMSFLGKTGLASVAGSKASRTATINTGHPIIKALKAL